MKKGLLYFIFLLFCFPGKAVEYVTIASGDWNSASIWTGALVPPTTLLSGDNITISNETEVSLNGNLTFNNNSMLKVDGSFTINGNISAADHFSLQISGRLAVDGFISANNNHSASINGNTLVTSDYTVVSTATINIPGTLTIYNDLTGTSANQLNGSGTFFIQGIISGFDISGFSGDLEDGFLTITGFTNYGAYIKLTSGSCLYIDGNANGQLNSTFSEGTDGLITSDGMITLEGNWNNFSSDSIFKNRNSTGTVLFKGSTSQQIYGSQVTEFENIGINNTLGLQIVRNTLVNHQLNFINGNMGTGVNDTLIIKNNATNAILNQDASRNITGNLRRYLTTGTYQFPLSHGGDYLPAIIVIDNLGSMNYVSAKFTSTASETVPLGLNVFGTPIFDFLDRGYWTFTPDNGSGVQYDITLTSEGHTNGGAEASQHAIFKRDGGDWENVGDHDNLTQSGSGTSAITVTRSNLTGFSDFIIGVSESWPLPVSLVTFYGVCNSNGIMLYWETLTETENEKFVVEYSFDGLQFSYLAELPGAGNSNQPVKYSFLHRITSSALVYYKLTQYDFNGNNHEFAVLPVYCSNNFIDEIYIKEITSQSLEISFLSNGNDNASVELYDPLGKIITKKNSSIYEGENSLSLELNNELTGAYILRIYTTDQQFSKKIIIP